MIPSAAVYGHAGCITFHYLKFRRLVGIPFTNTSSMDDDVQVLCVTLFTFEKSFLNAGIPDCPSSGQSITRMNKNADARTSPVSE